MQIIFYYQEEIFNEEDEKKEEQKEITAKNIQMLLKSVHKLICLPEETSLWVTDDKIDVIGQKPATIFNGK